MAIGKFLSKLFIGQARQDHDSLRVAKETFRTEVIQAAKNLGSQSNFILNEDDPLLFHFASDDNEASGYIDLNNAYLHLQAYPEESSDDFLQQFAGLIVANENSDEGKGVSEDEIVVVIRPTEYVNYAKSRNDETLEKHLCGDLHCFTWLTPPMLCEDFTNLMFQTKRSMTCIQSRLIMCASG